MITCSRNSGENPKSALVQVEAFKRMRGRGYSIGNVDVTLICQKPRVNVEHNGGQVKERMVSANAGAGSELRTDPIRIHEDHLDQVEGRGGRPLQESFEHHRYHQSHIGLLNSCKPYTNTNNAPESSARSRTSCGCCTRTAAA